MKRIVGMVIVVMVILSWGLCFAQSNGEKGKFSTYIVIKNDFGFPQEGKDYTMQALCAYWHYQLPGSWSNVGIGGGIDSRVNFEDDFLEGSPYITLNHGPWYVLVGGVIDSGSQNFVQTGIWYINSWQIKKIAEFDVILDVRNYWPVEGKNLDPYIDNFVEITTPIGRFFVGTDLEYVHWWTGPSHNYVSVGPIVGYKFTKNISVFVRPTYDGDFEKNKTTGIARVRVGLILWF